MTKLIKTGAPRTRPNNRKARGASIAKVSIDESRLGTVLPFVDALEARAHERGEHAAGMGAAFRAATLVRMMRAEIGLSQSALARRLGVSQARVSEIESGFGTHGPSWDLMERIAAACDAAILVRPAETNIAIELSEAVQDAQQWTLVATAA